MTPTKAINFMRSTGGKVALSPWGYVVCYMCHQDKIVRISLEYMTACAATVVDVLSVNEFLTYYDDLELVEYDDATRLPRVQLLS